MDSNSKAKKNKLMDLPNLISHLKDDANDKNYSIDC